jgi:ADP-ribosyl-[dinitrogen reductase] hydrolase
MFESPSIRSIARGDYQHKAEAKIHATGYVVRSLEAALWCFCQTDSFEQAILKAANLGDDADTTAAICGQVAGAFYGEEGIPQLAEVVGNGAMKRMRARRTRSAPGELPPEG